MSPNHSLFQIIPPTKDENRYRYRIRVAGIDYSAYLTYELPRKSDERTILMVNAAQPFIVSESKAEYDRLFDRIKETLSRFTGVKNIVNRLADNEFADLPNVRVAVHKYGPVPVYLLAKKYTINYLGDALQVQIGVYPEIRLSTGGKKHINLKLPFLSTKSEFLRSLNIGLGLMFHRYLEDVGEGMYDIKHHLNLAGVFDRAKEIETILAESIKSKLDVAIPSAQVFSHPSTEDEKRLTELFERERDWILTARYARQFALYFLNELYRLIGLEPRSESYLKGFGEIEKEFDRFLGAGYMREAIARLPLVAILSKAIRNCLPYRMPLKRYSF